MTTKKERKEMKELRQQVRGLVALLRKVEPEVENLGLRMKIAQAIAENEEEEE